MTLRKLPPFWPQSLFLENEWDWYRVLPVVTSVTLAPSGGRGTCPRLRGSLRLQQCPVQGVLLQETLEGWQTAAGVKWR